MRRHSTKGQSIAEYVILAGMIAMSTIGALNVFGDSLSDKAEEFWVAFNANGPAAATVPTIAAAMPAAPPTGVQVALGGGGTVMQGSYTNAEELFNSLNNMVETGGAHGVTKETLGYLGQVVQQKLDAGEITQEDANELLWLADKGYEMAEVHAVIQNVMNATDPANLDTTAVSYGGQTYANVEELSKAQFHINGTMSNFNIETAFTTDDADIDNGTVLQSFVAKYKKMNTEGQFDNLPPDLSLLVQNSAKMIVQLADEVDDTITYNNTPPEEQVLKIKEKNAATVTKANAEIIENAAGGSGQGANNGNGKKVGHNKDD